MFAPRALPIPDRARLARVVESDYQFVWRLLRRLGVSPQSVDDATQQVFLVVAERLPDVREGSERSFAFGAALRIAQSLRRRAHREPASAETDERPSLIPGPDQLTEQRRNRERLDRVLSELSIELRSVFVLYELEGLSAPEIAELCELPLGTVSSRLRRARERFRELIRSQVWMSPPFEEEP